jgi:hypothetical protein
MNFQTSKTPSRLRISSTISRVALAVALTLSANGAMAATSQVHKTIKPAHAVHTRQAAAVKYRPSTQQQFGLPDFLAAAFGGFAAPLVTHGSRAAGARATAASSDNDWQVYDQGPAPVEVDNSQSQAAIDASDAAMQQEDQDLQALDASVAASEQQNDAANAAAVQTDINAGM